MAPSLMQPATMEEIRGTEAMAPSVGQRLRQLRERVGVSQRELARRASQSAAAISAIELDKVSPSIETLKRLLDSLGETLSDFFAVGSNSRPAVFFAPEDLIEVSFGLIHYHQLSGNFGRDSLQFVQARAEPGSDTHSVTHQDYDSEVGFVLTGRIEVSIDDETRVLSPGDGYVIQGNRRIRIRNIFGTECTYIFVSTTAGMPSIVQTKAGKNNRQRP